ncbi:MAG: hypothetical protein HRU46_01030 [Verrucomicrobiales bacterium]|nr:hypothetical protein [Verrucomicrobiales bacterium]
MTNCFAILGLSESLTLDPGDIESSWQAATREEHPDSSPGTEENRAAELNQARATLSLPVERLGHWLQLKLGEFEPNRSIDPELMDLFASIHSALESADSVISRHQKSTTALTKALLAKEAVNAQLAIQEQMAGIHSLKQSIIDSFPDLEKAGESGDFEEAKRNLGQLKFLTKWEQQCQSRLLSLLEC